MTRLSYKFTCLPVITVILLAGSPDCCRSAAGTIVGSENTILTRQKKINRLKQGISEQKNKIARTTKRASSLLTELDKIDRKALTSKGKLKELNKKLDRLKFLIEKKEDELALVQEEKGRSEEHVKQRLSAYYRIGKTGLTDVVFSAASLPDLVNLDEYLQIIIKNDQEVIAGYRNQLAMIGNARDSLRRENERLLAVIKQVEEQKRQLTAARENRAALLARVNTEKDLYKRALQEMEKAGVQLNRTLEKLETDESHPALKAKEGSFHPANRGGVKRFAAMKGLLAPPVTGTVITRFGKQEKGKFGISTFAEGVDIRCHMNCEIKAVFDGTVKYAARLRGYGKTIIIEHDDRYFTLIAGAAQLYKKEGEAVTRGEVLGITGGESGLLRNGLHFEIRHGSEPEDPLLWIDNSILQIPGGTDGAGGQ